MATFQVKKKKKRYWEDSLFAELHKVIDGGSRFQTTPCLCPASCLVHVCEEK